MVIYRKISCLQYLCAQKAYITPCCAKQGSLANMYTPTVAFALFYRFDRSDLLKFSHLKRPDQVVAAYNYLRN